MLNLDQAYITERDRYVMAQWNKGVEADTIAEVLGLHSAEEVRAIFTETESKLMALLYLYQEMPSASSVYDFLEEIGICRTMWGAVELSTAIQLAMANPDLMNQMEEKFFPALAEELNLAPRTVRNHMYQTLNHVYSERIRNNEDVSFFEQIGKCEHHHLRIRSFLVCALNRINYFLEREYEFQSLV